MRIGVTSISFSKNETLRTELTALFPGARFNLEGKRMSESDVAVFLKDCDGAIIGTEPLGEKALVSLPRLQIVAKYGVGLDTLDLEAMARRGVSLGWTGGVNKRSVSELALWFILGLVRNAAWTSRLLAAGTWEKDGGRLLSGKAVGVVGCGNTGEDLLRLLAPFGGSRFICDIEDRSMAAVRYGAVQLPLQDLLRMSDIVSLHVPLTEQTRGMLDADRIALLRPGAVLVNTARGGVVDQPALKNALAGGRIQAGLDVFATEPETDLGFLALRNLVATPHVGGNAAEAVLAMGRSAIAHLKARLG